VKQGLKPEVNRDEGDKQDKNPFLDIRNTGNKAEYGFNRFFLLLTISQEEELSHCPVADLTVSSVVCMDSHDSYVLLYRDHVKRFNVDGHSVRIVRQTVRGVISLSPSWSLGTRKMNFLYDHSGFCYTAPATFHNRPRRDIHGTVGAST